jgi:DNA-directed RNA polymerase specialized sigma24 family protein/ribosome-associated translation inhibitor RaiA
MNVHISYKTAKAPDVEREFAHHIQKLDRRLLVFRPDLVHLHGIVDQGSSLRGETSISLNLRLPSGQLASQQSGPTAVRAMKAAFSELLKQLTKHKDLLRGFHRRARRKAGNGLAKQIPFEQTFAAVHPPLASVEDIYSFVNANLVKIERFIVREMRYRTNQAQVDSEAVDPKEVLDEVVATALGEEENKPELLTLERWMYRLAIQAINRLTSNDPEQENAVPLERSERKRNVTGSDEAEMQFHQPDETLLAESVIADRRQATPEEITYSDEMINLVEVALLRAKKEDREAFILYAVEGFTLDEIATTTERNDEQVRKSIHNARTYLKKTLHIPNPFKDRLLQHSRIA